jgi:PIN domain nuclease of toxin-antitoxin system
VRFLLDTHALLWALNSDPALSSRARKIIEAEENELLVSAASVWEIATKVRLGKLPTGAGFIADLDYYFRRLNLEELPVSVSHAARAGTLPGEHRDPFDRMLIAQAQSENIPIISNDRIFDVYHVARVW